MGKKKKNKSKLLNDDYTNISSDDQFKLLELSDRLMRGEDIKIFGSGTGNKKPVQKKKPQTTIVMDNKQDCDIFRGVHSPQTSAKSLVDNLIKTQMGASIIEDIDDDIEEDFDEDFEDGTLNEYVRNLHQCTAVIKKCDDNGAEKEIKIENVENPHSNHILEKFTGETKGTLEGSESSVPAADEDIEEEEEPTLDNMFKVLTEDMDLGDIVINDAWKRYKSHTISFLNMKAATIDYQNSPLYDEMCTFLDFAVAVIAGPVLIIKEGNPKFQKLIDSVESLDNERIFIVSKTDEDLKNDKGEPATHFLMYYIDRESKELLNILIEGWEDNGDNEIVLDFLYSVYKKVTDRYENPFSIYSGIDVLIENFESSDNDIDFVTKLILEDEDTVVRSDIGGNHYEHFLKNIVMSRIEGFVACPKNPMPIFEVFKNLLSIYFEKDIPEDEIIQIPVNFGVANNSGVNEPNTSAEESADISGEIILEPKVTKSIIIEEFAAVDDVEDGSDIDLDEFVKPEERDTIGDVVKELSDVLHIDGTTQQEINPETMQVEILTTNTTDSEVKKFGSKPYDGGSMIVTV